jgi:hypothetical protein
MRYSFAIALLLSPVTPVMAQEAEKKEIVVTARSLKDTADALRQCLERKCPPDEDVKATLAHAENLFVDGDYKSSRATLLASLGRNRKHKKGFPVDVSNLLRANANIAAQLGEGDSYRLSILDMRDTLRGAFREDDTRVLGAEIEVADSRQRMNYYEEARQKYKDVADKAMGFGKPDVAAIAQLRVLSSFVQEAQKTKTEYDINRAYKAIDAFVAAPPKGAESFGIVGEILRTRLDRTSGKKDTTDELIKRYTALGLGGKRPVLIAANPIKANEADVGRAEKGGSDLNRLSMSATEKRWVDIGFWINATGHVEDIEILRSAGRTAWVKPVIDSINSRIYTPAKSANGETPGFYAVERYSLTADWVNDATGTHIRQRSAVPTIERIGLSD